MNKDLFFIYCLYTYCTMKFFGKQKQVKY